MGGLARGLLRFAMGLAAGAAIGTVAGRLFAPSSGEQLRGRFQARLDEALAAGERAQQEQEAALRRDFERHVAQYEKPRAEG